MKRKILTYALASAMTLSSIVPAMASSDSNAKDNIANDSNIETLIGFKYPETIESLKSKELKAVLSGDETNIEISLNDLLENNSVSKSNYEIISEVNQEDGKVNSIKFKIDGLKPLKKYNLTIDGKHYIKTSVELDTTEYSKRVNINTGSTMSLGDVNNDNLIDEKDLKLLEENLNKDNSEYDLNGDGVISISDIAIVNKNMQSTILPVVYDTEAVSSAVLNKVDTSEMTNKVSVEEGNIEDIFKPNTSVKLKPKENEEKVSIPITFKDDAEPISTFSLTLPDGTPEENVEILFYDDNGDEIRVPAQEKSSVRLARSLRSNETVVTVNLGTRVPVKKITVNVKPSDDGFVVIKDVKFLKDVVDDNILEDTKVKNIKVTPGDEKVSLSWRAVPNVKGYKIYYGLDKSNLNQSKEVQSTNAEIDGLENLKTYYFQIAATAEGWEGTKSDIISATPEPKTIPERPDFLKAEGGNASIKLSWKEAKNAEWYNVYAKKGNDGEVKKVLSNVKETSTTINGLENGVEYTIYVTSENTLGESSYSEPAQATPIKEEIVPPTLPTNQRISNENIESVEISHKDHYDSNLYPSGFDTKWLIDGDYETSWVARRWWDENSFTFTFKEAKDMNYLVWVPRLDGQYKNSNENYSITVWTEDDLEGPGKEIVSAQYISQRGENNSYYVLTFPKQTKVKKIKVKLGERAGGPRVNASEVAFYEYNDISDRIANLFANDIRTELKSNVKAEDIQALEEEVNDVKGYIYDKEILLDELKLAKGLLENNKEVLGIVKEGVDSIDGSVDTAKYGKAINNYQPLGLAGKANQKIAIYADIPEGETVNLVATQFFEQADSLQAPPITLVDGVNYITIPKIGSVSTDRGGPLYITYSGDKKDQIKLHIRGGYKIPYLELKDFRTIGEEEAKKRIGEFIDELTEYPKTLKGNMQINDLNTVEISMPDVLLSLPATEILKGIQQDTSSKEEQINKVYDNVLAWEDLIDVVYKTYGIDDHKKDGLQTRQNIRYMKMFSGAFMYASGNHIGIGYDSVAPLMNGKPVSKLEENAEANEIFGWGIAHEIGHVMDGLGKAEVTNNIFSLMAQTYDGESNTLKSRLEINNVYDKVYEKVSVGGEGVPNDLFAQLAMYWQLHLAYDDAENPTRFYNEIYKLYRTEELNSFNGMDKFAVAASKVANKNLTTFFERWGVKLSESAKSEMNKYSTEERAIYYLNDESRRQRLENNQGNKNITVSATSSVSENENKDQVVTITIEATGQTDNILGYEISRNGKSIGFTTTGTYEDIIDSANNTSFEYKVTPIDVLGNISQQQDAGEVRISYDDVIESSKYTISEEGVVTFAEPVIVSGIKLTPKGEDELPKDGTFTVTAKISSNLSDEQQGEETFEEVVAKNGDFSKNSSKNKESYIAYFNKPNASESELDKMWSYETSELKLSGIDLNKYNIEFIQYPGDDIQFMETSVGLLESEFGDIPAGTLVIMGTYRGNTSTNEIIIKGKYSSNSSLEEGQPSFEERPINGDIYMLDTIEEGGKITSSTEEGIFIFVPDIQKEAELQGTDCSAISALPSQIKAEMTKKDINGERLTSDTLWTNMPSFDTLPTIRLTGGQ